LGDIMFIAVDRRVGRPPFSLGLSTVSCLQAHCRMSARILVVAARSGVRESICLHLSVEGYQCDAYSRLEDVSVRATGENAAAAVMSLEATLLASRDMTHFVSNEVPKLLLSEPDGEEAAVSALQVWADDYVTAPFEMRELIARVHALTRRQRMSDGNGDSTLTGDQAIIAHDGFFLSPSRRLVKVDDRALTLTENEFKLIQRVARRPGTVVPRKVLSALFAAELTRTSRTVDSLVTRVRRKLRAAGSRWAIATVRGAGYTFTNSEKG
jgi:DNA-binding response OmpR family regulator